MSDDEEALLRAHAAPGERPGTMALLSGAVVLLGVLGLAAVAVTLGPVHEAFVTLGEEGATAPAPEEIEADPDLRARYLRVRGAALAYFRVHEHELRPIVTGRRSLNPSRGLARLDAWAALRRVWADALEAEGLEAGAYRALSRTIVAAPADHEPGLDALLQPPGA